jgi:porin
MQQEVVQSGQRIEQFEKRHSALESIVNKVSVGGVLAGAYQYQLVNGPCGVKDRGRGAVPIQPEISITLTDVDEMFFKLGFAAGNGLNEVAAFNLTPWAADLEDDVKDINGRGRNYLLTAWYKHTFQIDGIHTLGITGGIIDATDYIDENAFSNDEFTQFMNEALVNGPNGFAPSYDIGGAVEWEYRNLSVKAVSMGVGENEHGNSYSFWGVQCGYRLETVPFKGNYRVVYERTSADFLDPGETDEEYCQAYYLSCDQELGPILGVWIRLGTHDDDAAMVYQNLFSGGVNVSGTLWGREQDNIGLGYAYLNQGNLDIDKTQLFEAYIRASLNDIAAVTFDVQYEDDDYKSGISDDVHGWITGMRMTVEF